MKKSSPTPKELMERRISKNKLLKLPKNEVNFDCKENVNPLIINNIKNNAYKKPNMEFKECPQSLFVTPDHTKLLNSRKIHRKQKPEPFIMSEVRAISDIDPNYYKIINGRPVRQLVDNKMSMTYIRKIVQFKTDAGYLKDKIMSVDTTITGEMSAYKKVNNYFNQCKQNFLHFVLESYNDARRIQDRAATVSLELAETLEQFEACNFTYVMLRNRVSYLAISMETRFMYARFLDSFSPPWWKEDFGNPNEKNTFLNCIEMETAPSESESFIKRLKMVIATLKNKPRLFFIGPKALKGIFSNIGRQCSTYLQIHGKSNILNKAIMKHCELTKAAIQLNITEINDYIERFEEIIKFDEDRAETYKKVFHKIIFSEFYKLYASYDNVKLFTCVQYVHNQVFGNPEDPHDNLVTLMRDIESHYFELTSGLDSLNQGVVKAATSEFFSRDIKLMNQANKAQRILKEFNILKNGLYTSFEPPRKKTLAEMRSIKKKYSLQRA